MKIMDLDFTRIAHDTFKIKGSRTIYTDPFRVPKRDEADIVLLSHEHFDHFSLEDLEKVVFPGTTIVASTLCREGLKGLQGLKVKDMRFLDPGGRVSVGKVQIATVPAYNINKFKEPGLVFHPAGEKRLGFIISMDGARIYFAADTDFIPEMHDIAVDIAMLPVSGTYVMTPEEAAEAALAIHPKFAIPMHYGAIVGSDADALKFKELVKHCQVEIL